MKCEHYRLRLLATETPGQPAPEVEDHLAACPACREWQQRLLQIETLVPRLPVPASRTRAAFLERFLRPSRPGPAGARRGGKWRLVAAGLAAAVLISVGGFIGNFLWNTWRQPDELRQNTTPLGTQPKPATRDTLVSRLLQCDLRLARATGPKQRARALADLADALQTEVRTLVRHSGIPRLIRLARLYSKVVRQGLVPGFRAVPAGQRQKVLAPIAKQLARAERNAERLARESPGSARPLRLIARAAREGRTSLRGLLAKDAS
jgi:hypothetical protein